MESTTIAQALVIKMIDSKIPMDGPSGLEVVELLSLAEARVIDANTEVLGGGNRDLDGFITDAGRRNLLHATRNAEFVEAMIEAAVEKYGPLFKR